MEIRRSYDRLISTMGLPILVWWHFYIESGPCSQPRQVISILSFCFHNWEWFIIDGFENVHDRRKNTTRMYHKHLTVFSIRSLYFIILVPVTSLITWYSSMSGKHFSDIWISYNDQRYQKQIYLQCYVVIRPKWINNWIWVGAKSQLDVK